MTPQKKAIDLLYKVNNKVITALEWEKTSDYAKADLKRKVELICDEIIQVVPSIYLTEDKEVHSGHRQYWQEVKDAINLL